MKTKITAWMSRNNMMFSAIAGETVKNSEVLYAHLGFVVFLLVTVIAGGIE